MNALTPEQQAVVDAPMVALCVIACAGSGKTKTAVHRLVQMRRNLGDARGRVALLSFSNVAVDTFRKAYSDLGSNLPSGADGRGSRSTHWTASSPPTSSARMAIGL